MFKRFSLTLLTLLYFSFSPFSVHAQAVAPNCPNVYPGSNDAGLFENVQCSCVESGNCSAGDFMHVVKNASQLIFGLAGAAALLMFIAGGFMLIVSSGNQQYVDRGKQILRAASIGLAIIFAAWLIINTIVVALTGTTSGTIFGSQWFELRL